MKKLSILHTETSPDWDGQMIRILTELEGFQTRGHAVAFVAQPGSEIIKRAAERGIPVEAVNMNRPDVPRSIWQVMQILKKRQVDIVGTHASRDSWIAGIAARLSKWRPIVIKTRHHSAPVKKGFMSGLLYQRLSDYVVTTGEAIRKQLIAEHSFSADHIVSIPTGIDLQRFSPCRCDPETVRNELGCSKGPLIAIIGGFATWKGHEDFIAAAAEILKIIPEARFYIVGTGSPADVGRVRTAVTQYRLQNEVCMLGYREDIPEILSAMDLLVHCSYANEGLPQVVLQAMAMEKPVVATRVGAISEAVFDGVTGYLINSRNVQLMADRVIDLLQDDLKRKAFGQAGRRLVKERYSLEMMLDRLGELYEGLLAKRGRDA
jgi:glycosyltransferase involved in cell wall biosynthesis